jgi:hypothetical protein
MSKNHRGTGIRSLPAHGRATCLICKKDNVKCLYEQEVDGQTVNICKVCKATLKNKARIAAKSAPKAESAAAAE